MAHKYIYVADTTKMYKSLSCYRARSYMKKIVRFFWKKKKRKYIEYMAFRDDDDDDGTSY